MKDLRIRPATFGDAQVLIDFNSAMALETEDKQLLPEVIGAGVRRLLEQPASGFYASPRQTENGDCPHFH